MSGAASHDQLRDLISAAALESLEPAEQARVLAHAAVCPECAMLLSEYREVVAAMSALVPERGFEGQRREAVRARLLARIRDERARGAERSLVAAPASETPLRFVKVWSGWLVAAGFAGVLLMHHAVHRPVDYGWLAAGSLGVVLVALVILAGIQRRQVSALRMRLAQLEEGSRRDPPENGRLPAPPSPGPS